MTCPRCNTELKADASMCPDCGVQLVRNVSGVMKTSAVMIASGDEHGFYHSVQDVPEPLRTQLIEVTNSANAGTIVIADRAGKEQLTQVVARRDSSRERVMASGAPADQGDKGFLGFTFLGYSGIAWAGFVLLLVAGTIIAAVFATRW